MAPGRAPRKPMARPKAGRGPGGAFQYHYLSASAGVVTMPQSTRPHPGRYPVSIGAQHKPYKRDARKLGHRSPS